VVVAGIARGFRYPFLSQRQLLRKRVRKPMSDMPIDYPL
jgi:hypothetical protein